MGQGPGYCEQCYCPEPPRGWRYWRARIAYLLVLRWPSPWAEKLMFAFLPYAGEWAYSCYCHQQITPNPGAKP